MTEKQFQSTIVHHAKKQGWLIFHDYDSRRNTPGFPDLILVRGGRVLFRELKTDKGRLTDAQKAWGEALTKAGSDYAVWRVKQLKEIFTELF